MVIFKIYNLFLSFLTSIYLKLGIELLKLKSIIKYWFKLFINYCLNMNLKYKIILIIFIFILNALYFIIYMTKYKTVKYCS